MTLPALLLALSFATADTGHARLIALIGEESPRAAYAFGKVSGFAFDAAGRLYVSDFQDAQVVVFGVDGAKLAVIGRKGEGPGEFTAPTGPAVGPDGALYVRNLIFVSRFTADPRTGILSRFDRTLEGPGLAPWTSMRATPFDATRHFYFPLEWMDGVTERPVRSFVRYTIGGGLLDTLPIPRFPKDPSLTASLMTSAHSGRMIPGLNAAPFEPRSAWAVTPSGTILSGDGDDPTLQETDRSGRTLRRIVVGGAGRTIPSAERAESLSALERRIDSLPGPLSALRGTSEAVRTQRLPGTYPAYTGLLIVADELWVRRWAPRGHTWFDRFTLAGAHRNVVELPVECANDPMPVVRGGRLACLVIDPETGAESVALLALP